MSIQIKLSKLSEDERLQRIYRTAAKVIQEKGYDATSLNDIAEALGITKGGLYHYIDGKQSLLNKIMSYAMNLLETEVVKPVKKIPDAESQLRTLIELHAGLIIDKAAEMTILIEETTGLLREDKGRILKRRVKHYKFVRGIIDRLKAEGKAHGDIDSTILAHSIIGQLHWLARWYRPNGRLNRRQTIDEFTKSVLAVVLPRSTAESAGKKQLNMTDRRKRLLHAPGG